MHLRVHIARQLYQLNADGKIRAYKLGAKTLIDLNTIDELYASHPRIVPRGVRTRGPGQDEPGENSTSS